MSRIAVDEALGSGDHVPPGPPKEMTLHEYRVRSMAAKMKEHWKYTPWTMARTYAERCISGDPLTAMYIALKQQYDELLLTAMIAAQNRAAATPTREEIDCLMERDHPYKADL